MPHPLEGLSILIVEDEPLIAMDIAMAFGPTGAALTTTTTLHHAMVLVENDGLAGVMLDHALGNNDSTALCVRLRELGVPFMVYSGFAHIDGPCGNVPHVNKPATHATLVNTMTDMIRDAPRRS